MELKNLPNVKKIDGGSFTHADTPQAAVITIQYQGTDGKLYQVDMPFLDGMYLMNILKSMKKDSWVRYSRGIING